jgi:hypothetical protein
MNPFRHGWLTVASPAERQWDDGQMRAHDPFARFAQR